jgi:hypothetical protein
MTVQIMKVTAVQKAVPVPRSANLANGCGLVEEAL